MSKSVYSLVLSDDVVAAVDRAAYALGSSRSNLINQILAEYVSFITPEKRRKDAETYHSVHHREAIPENQSRKDDSKPYQ